MKIHRKEKQEISKELGSNSPLISEEMLLDQLAAILVEGFLAIKSHEYTTKSSHVLPGIDKRTG